MDNILKMTCACGETNEINLSEEYNHKDIVNCSCGRRFLIVEITE